MLTYSFLSRPTVENIEQILTLYKAESWWITSSDDTGLARQIVSGSHCFLVVKEGKKVVGMGRAISDGVSDAYIQDVAVEASLRGRGIGSKIIRKLLERLNHDGVNWVGLIAERGSHEFYRQLGFDIMPDSTPMVKIGSDERY